MDGESCEVKERDQGSRNKAQGTRKVQGTRIKEGTRGKEGRFKIEASCFKSYFKSVC